MKFLKFLKKLKKVKNQPEQEIEKISFSELENHIDSKQIELNQEQREIYSLIDERFKNFASNVFEKIKILEAVDVDSKKSDERLKAHSKEGRNKLVHFVDQFVRNLEGLIRESKESNESVDTFTMKINDFFLNFNKMAGKSYERTTILIGKEAREVKDTVQKFHSDISTIFKDKKDTLDNLKALRMIKVGLGELEEIKEQISSMEQGVDSTIEEIKHKSEETKKILEEIEEIKKSSEHLEYIKRQKDRNFLLGEIEKEVFRLRQLIDFKTLGNFYHPFPEKMEIVKTHRENFATSFNKDNGESISNLIKEAKLKHEGIQEKINTIKDKKQNLSVLETELEEDETKNKISSLNSKLANITMELGSLRNKKPLIESKLEKLKINKGKIIEKIKKDAREVGVEII